MENIEERGKIVIKKEGSIITAVHPEHARFKMQRVIPKKLLDHEIDERIEAMKDELLKFIDCMV